MHVFLLSFVDMDHDEADHEPDKTAAIGIKLAASTDSIIERHDVPIQNQIVDVKITEQLYQILDLIDSCYFPFPIRFEFMIGSDSLPAMLPGTRLCPGEDPGM